jgi:PEGA domain-containing protein
MTDQGSLDMLRRLAAVVVCALLLAAVPTGSLYVTTLPSGADVWIDGAYVGRSPLVVGALTTGGHAVGLTKSGWAPLQLDVTVEAGQTTLSSTRLEATKARVRPPAGSIAIHGTPANRAYLDGVPAVPSKDGTIPAAAGTHEIAFRTSRGRVARSVTVWPQTRTDVVFQPDVEAPRPSVVAPAEDYVPRSAIQLEGDKVVVRYGEHVVVGHIGITTYRVDGKSVDYGEAPTMIGRRLYLPLDLLTSLFSGNR